MADGRAYTTGTHGLSNFRTKHRLVPLVPFLFTQGAAPGAPFPEFESADVIEAASIDSAEAFGTAALTHVLTADAIASAEAFGTAVIGGTLGPSSIASAEAFETPALAHALAVTSIASAEAFGTALVASLLVAPSIDSAEAFETASLTLALTAPSIASAEAISTDAVINQNLVATSIDSAEAFDTAMLAHALAATSIDSVEAVSIDATIAHLDGAIESLEAFGTPSVTNVLLVNSIASAEAHGTASLTHELSVLAGIASAEAFGPARVENYQQVSVFPATGTLGRQNDVIIVGTILDMTASMPVGDLYPSFWGTNLDTLTGRTTQVTSGILFDTGANASAVTGLRTATDETHIDVEVSLEQLRGTGTFKLALHDVSANSSVQLLLSRSELRFRIYMNGALLHDQPITNVVTHSGATLRLLRTPTEVIAFVGGQLRVRAPWIADGAMIEMSLSGAASSQVTLTDYIRSPVVLFDSVPVTQQVARSRIQWAGTAPTASKAGPVDITVVGSEGNSVTLSDAYTYTLPSDAPRIIQSGTTTLTVLR